MLKHMAAHNASLAFATVESVIRPERETVPPPMNYRLRFQPPEKGNRFGFPAELSL
jgi:hypothetical protein